jgi:FlaA1/EpsC-like NDP-sugar epimerase
MFAIERLLKDYKVQMVFHAAAYKHVPLLEPQIRAAVKNNILGTYNLAQAAALENIEKFVLVSTDKAVNPTNVMGATKRIAELVCQYFNERYSTSFITVRFGNVLGSRGSVVETFQQQLENGGPLTVTHPEVMRYFMTVQEASQLILQALAIGAGGELFVLDMGEPIKIRYMAEQMIRLAGKRKDEDIRIEYVGLRPGEKLFEELFHKREQLAQTSHTKILKAHPRILDPKFEKSLLALQVAVNECQEHEIFRIIKELVPELRQTRQAKVAKATQPINESTETLA